MNVRTALLAVVALAAGCKPSLLPGTEIPSTSDTRAVYDVLQAYRTALEKRDPKAVLALVAPTYYDTAGTPEPGDDLDRAGLEASLAKDLPRTEGEKVDFTIRRIEVSGDEAVADRRGLVDPGGPLRGARGTRRPLERIPGTALWRYSPDTNFQAPSSLRSRSRLTSESRRGTIVLGVFTR